MAKVGKKREGLGMYAYMFRQEEGSREYGLTNATCQSVYVYLLSFGTFDYRKFPHHCLQGMQTFFFPKRVFGQVHIYIPTRR